jgi:hypothetical protein
MKSRLDEKEIEVLALTAKLFNLLGELEDVHPDDIHEHRRDIHNIQNRIMARPEQRFQNTSKND